MQQLLCIAKERLGRLRRRIERLAPYPALFTLIVPLTVVEPLKLATIWIAGEGHWITSAFVLLFAYAVSLFVTHWLFDIVKPTLLTLPWFAGAWEAIVTLRYKIRLFTADREPGPYRKLKRPLFARPRR